MFEEEIKQHQILFSGSPLEMGKIHWYIQKADSEMEKRRYVNHEEEGLVDVMEEVLTPLGEEVGSDEIHWWIFERETNVRELFKRTKDALISAQKLKEDSLSLKEKVTRESYVDLVAKIKELADRDGKEIHALYDYVVWLHSKDVLAPIMLFSNRVWGTTRRFDKMVKITAGSVDEDQQTVERCTEVAFGLREKPCYTIEKVYVEIVDETYGSVDPEDEWPSSVPVPKEALLVRTSYEALDELAAYSERIRDSLRNIVLEIERYNEPVRLLHDESFWKRFITKAMADNRVETQLWDFKNTLEMWHCSGKVKQEYEVAFSEQVSSYANSSGGVLIIGITNESPRMIVGIQDLENNMKSTKSVIDRCTGSNAGFVHFQQIRMKDESGQEHDCLIIVIAQTKNVIGVKDQQGRYTYPTRQATGLHKGSRDEILQSKRSLPADNYKFMQHLRVFLEGQ